MDSVPPVLLKHEVHLEQAQCVLRSLMSDRTFTDLLLRCEDQVSLTAHRAVLAYSSPYLARLIQQDSTTPTTSIDVPFRSDMMKNILEYLYLGETKVIFSNVKEFLSATKTLLIQDQKKKQDTDEKLDVEEDKLITDYCQTVVKSEDEVFNSEEKDYIYEDEEEDERDIDYEMEEIKTIKFKEKKGQGRGRGRPPKDRDETQNSKTFPCNQCDFVAPGRRPLQKHKREMHEANKVYQCEFCEYSGSKAGLYAHREIHTNERMFCDLCSYNTLKKVHFINHKKYVHFEGQRITCDLCDFTCKKEKDLRYHRERKHEGKCFVCDKCEYTSKYLHRLRDHIKGVHEDNKYKCNKCDYSTIHKSVLLTHTKVEHENRQKHLCTHCGFQTARKYNLDAHIKSMHYGIKRDQSKRNNIMQNEVDISKIDP